LTSRPSTGSPQCFQPAFMDTDSFELLHHYTSATCLILSRSRNIDIWQVAIPRMALKHDFLMHGILALSALHLSRIQPSRAGKLTVLASAHEQLALPSFRKHISQNFSNDTCHAVFSFSGFVIPFILASENSLEASTSRIPGLEDGSPHWFYAIRGLMVLLTGNWSTLVQGPYAPLLVRTSAPIPYANNPNESHLVEVQQLISSCDDFSDAQETIACQIAFDELCRTLSSPCKTGGYKAAFLIWPGVVPTDYVRLLHYQHPIALIILAHYCVVIKKIETVWYLRGLGQNLLLSIHEVLSPKWRPWLVWPMKQPVCW
jgi:Fungal specific transcription factor domain